jgi:hypothetical protein
VPPEVIFKFELSLCAFKILHNRSEKRAKTNKNLYILFLFLKNFTDTNLTTSKISF